MEHGFSEALKLILQTSGGAAVLLYVGKWLLAEYLKNQEEVRKLEKEAVKGQIGLLDKLMSELKIEVMALKDRIYHNEKQYVEGISRMTSHSDKLVSLTKAMEGFAKTTNERLTIVEAKADQVIRVGKEMAARLRGKTGSE
jgi:hypothetical protein